MYRFKKLLVHLDLHGQQDRAVLRYAASVATLARSAQVDFVHTIPETSLVAGWFTKSMDQSAKRVQAATAEIRKLIATGFRPDVKCRTRIHVYDQPGLRDLLDELRRRDIDMVIAGKNESDSTTAEKLARKAPCSVMIVPPRGTPAYRRIVVPLDFSEYSGNALEVATAFAKARNLKRIDCFHSYQVPYGYHKTGIPRENFRKDIEEWAKKCLADLEHGLPKRSIEAVLTCGEFPFFPSALLNYLKQRKCNLLIMSARGKDALSQALLGSNTAEVLRHSPIPTLIVKPKGAGLALLDLLFGRK